MKPWLCKSYRIARSLPVLFVLFLIWFFQGTTWYPSATLLVRGTVIESLKPLEVWWDSGQGLNGYERERFQFVPLPQRGDADGLSLRITRTGTRNGAAAGNKVVLRSIVVDEEEVELAGLALAPGITLENGNLVFIEDHSTLSLKIKPKFSLRLEFPAFNYAGEVDVQLEETTSRHDLYASNNESQWGGQNARIVKSWFVSEKGEFSVSLPMPRYRINALRITPSNNFTLASTDIVTESGEVFALSGGEYRGGIIFSTVEFDQERQRHFHPDRLMLQVVFAAFSAWLLSLLLGFVGRFGGIKEIIISDSRYLFWLMLLASCTTFSFWHISFWPAVMSNDSLEVWRAAQLPGIYLGDHPPLNVFFYLYLSQFWNNVAVVPLAQNLFTSLLIASILFSLYRRGLPWFALFPCFVLIITSVPVGLYAAILWKDVPFALLTVLLGFELAKLYDEKRKKAGEVSAVRWLYMFCLIVAIIGFRHNGILYLLVVPAILLLFGIVRLRPRALLILCSLVLFVGLVFFLHPKMSTTSDYLMAQTRTYLKQAIKQQPVEYLKKSGENYLGIFNVHQKRMQWDLVHLCMYGRYTNDFIKTLRWNDVYPFLRFPKGELIDQMRDTAWALYWKSYQVPWVYFSWNSVYVLLLFPLLPLLYRIAPMTAVFSLFTFIPVAALVFLGIFNWRYYYFAHLSGYFLLPMVVADLFARRGNREKNIAATES
jgi:hypothetical protein